MRRQLRVEWIHELDGPDTFFQGGPIRVLGDRAVFGFGEGGPWMIRCLSATGQIAWERSWPDLGVFMHWADDAIYTGGERLRKIAIDDGRLLAEQAIDGTVNPWKMFANAVVYETNTSVQGRDLNTLEVLWDVPNEDGMMLAHQGRLCRSYGNEFITVTPPDTREIRVRPERPLATSLDELHAHAHGMWCQFSLITGGRTAIDEASGRVVWSFAEPPGYGVLAFDDESAYSTYPTGAPSSYDLRTGAQRWQCPTQMSSRAYVEGGKFYGGSQDGDQPLAFILDARTGEILLEGGFDCQLTGMGHEPCPVVPMGDTRLIIGMRKAVVCVAID